MILTNIGNYNNLLKTIEENKILIKVLRDKVKKIDRDEDIEAIIRYESDIEDLEKENKQIEILLDSIIITNNLKG